ncbi:MAG: hypothetical protein FGM44_00615, partial [Limnohabitans sp.]|nr:hypothetical protein [Limnohabitans sp.]
MPSYTDGSVAIYARAGAIRSALGANATPNNISANQLGMQAFNGIGGSAQADRFRTRVNSVAAQTSAGDIGLNESFAFNVTGLTDVALVQASQNGLSSRGLLFDEPMTGLRTGANGGVYILAQGLNVNASPAIGQDLGIAAGSGGITIELTGNGDNYLRGTLSATGGGAISVRSSLGGIVMSDDAVIRTEGGSVTLVSGERLVIGRVLAGNWSSSLTQRLAMGAVAQAGGVVLQAKAGSISVVSGLDLTRQPVILASALDVRAMGGIDAMEVAADSLQAVAGEGELRFTDRDGWGANTGLSLGVLQASQGGVHIVTEGSLQGQAALKVASGKALDLMAYDAINLSTNSTLVAVSGLVGEVSLVAGGLISAAARAFVRAGSSDKARAGSTVLPTTGVTTLTSANVAAKNNVFIAGDVVLSDISAAALGSLTLKVGGSLWITGAVPANMSLTLEVGGQLVVDTTVNGGAGASLNLGTGNFTASVTGDADFRTAVRSSGQASLTVGGDLRGRAAPRTGLTDVSNLATRAALQASSLTLDVKGDIAANPTATSSEAGKAAAGLSVAANILSVQGGGIVWLDNLSTAALTVNGITAGALTGTAGDIVLRSLASAITLAADVRALGGSGRLVLDAAGTGGNLTVADAVIVQAAQLSVDATLTLTTVGTGKIQADTLLLNTWLGVGVGTSSAPLRLDLQGSLTLLSGRVSGSLNLSELAGDLGLSRLQVGADSADATTRLQTLSGGIYGSSARTNTGYADLVASDVQLTATGNAYSAGIGGNRQALRLSSTTGTVTLGASATGAVIGDVVISSASTLRIRSTGVSGQADIFLASDRDLITERDGATVATVTANQGAVSLLSWQRAEKLSEAAGGLSTGRVTLDAPVVTAQAGTSIELVAGAGSINMGGDTRISIGGSGSGSVRLSAGESITLSAVNAPGALVALVARGGSIVDGDTLESATPDIQAWRILLDAAEDIGANRASGGALVGVANALELAAGSLAARSGFDLRLNETDTATIDSGLSVSVSRAGWMPTSSLTTALDGLRSTWGGDIVVTAGSATQVGRLTLAADTTIQTNGAGAIRLSALGTDSQLVLKGDLRAGSGAMELAASLSVNKLTAAQWVTTGDMVVRARDGLKLVDASGNVAAGTMGRDSSPGLLRIEGNQTLASNQHLALQLTGPQQGDRFEVTGTLTLAQGATLDITRSAGYVPQQLQHLDIVKAGTLVGQFTEGTGLFGFGNGSVLLQLSQAGQQLALDAVQRPLADLLDITVHSQTDADKLGMFFNADYFGVNRDYTVGMMLQAADFLTVDGRFVLRNSNATVTLADGSSAQTRRWTVGGANLSAFVGLNGPYRVDRNHDGDLNDEGESPNATAAGFDLQGVDVALALHRETAVTGGRDTPRSWLSLKATADTATEVGIPFMTLETSAMAIGINAGSAGENVVDLKAAKALSVATGDGNQTISLDFDAARGTQVKASSAFKLNIADFVTASGTLGFERSLREVVLADGTKANTEMLTFGGENLNAFVGLNGPSDGLYNASNQPDAVGLALTDVDFALALFSPRAGETATQGLKWAAVKATAASVQVVGMPELTVAARHLSLALNLVDTSGSTRSVNADNKVIDFAGGGGTRQLDVVTGTGRSMAIDLNGALGQYVRASGDVQLRVGDFFEVQGSLGFERRVQDVLLADGSKVKTQLITIGGTGLEAFVGFGPYEVQQNGQTIINPQARGVKVSDVEFGLALFTSKDAGYTDKRWTALTGSVGSIDATIGLPPDVDLNIFSLGIDINLSHGFTDAAAPNKVIDFASMKDTNNVAGMQIATGTGKALRLTHDGDRGQLLRASGGMALKLAGFVQTSGTMSIEKSDVRFKLAGAGSGTRPEVDTRVLTIGGTGLNAFVGINGPYRTDSNGDGVIDLRDSTRPDAMGVTVTNAEFGVLLAWDKTAGSSRNWVALQATADQVALVGVTGVTATAQKLSVELNLVNNALPTTQERTQVLDLAAQPFKVSTGYSTQIELKMDGSRGELIRATGDFEVGVAGFVYARGSLGLEKSTTTVQLADKSLVVVDQLLLGGRGLTLFAGVGGPYLVDSNLDGVIDANDQINESAVGFAMTGGEFALAMLSPSAGQAARYSGMRWMGLEASASTIQFVGVSQLDLQVKNLEVVVNQVFNVPDGTDEASQVVDFKARSILVPTATGITRTLDVQGDRGGLLRVSGDIQLRVGDFFYVGGSLGFEKSVRTLTLSDGSVVSHDVMTLGGANLQAFAGLSGGPLVDSNHDGKIDSNDTPGDDAMGFSLADVNFGLVLAAEREMVRETLAQTLEWRDIAVSSTRQVALARSSSDPKNCSLWVSNDGGQRWTQINTVPTGLRYTSVTISEDGQTLLVTVDGGGILRSINGGLTWAATAAAQDRYIDAVIVRDGRIVSADIPAPIRTDVIRLSGTWKVGDVVTVAGLATGDVSYTVVSDDLTSDGKGSAKKGSTDEVNANVAARLRKAINDAKGSLAQAGGNGPVVTLAARSDATDAGWTRMRVSVKGNALVESTRLANATTTQLDMVVLTSRAAEGDVISLSGISAQPITYTVTRNDLTAKGDGSGGLATDLQVQTNVLAKIQKMFDDVRQQDLAIESARKTLATYQAFPAYLDWLGTNAYQIKVMQATIANLERIRAAMPAANAVVTVNANANALAVYSKGVNQAFKLQVNVVGKTQVQVVRAADRDALRGTLQVSGQAAGTSWTETPQAAADRDLAWRLLAAYDAGTHVLAAADDGIFIGNVNADGSTVWARQTSGLPSSGWVGLDASEPLVSATNAAVKGSLLVLARPGDALYLADTREAGWTWKKVATPRSWTAVAVSADGSTIAAAANGVNGGIWVSNDAGVNWRLVNGTSGLDWRALGLNASGTQLTAAASGRGLFTTSVQTGTQALPTRVALEASAGAARLVGVPQVTAEITQASVSMNLADAVSHRVMDFSNNNFALVTGTGTTRTLSLSGAEGEFVRVQANARLDVAGVLHVEGSAAFDKRSATVKLATDKTVYVDQLTLGMSGVTGFFGVGGPYLVDSNHDGKIDTLDTPNASAVGLSLSNLNLAMGIFTPIQIASGDLSYADPKYATTKVLQGASWLGLSANVGAVSLVGLPQVTLTASALSLELNRVMDLPSGYSADAYVIDFKKTPVTVRTGPQTTSILTLDGQQGVLTRASGTVNAMVGDALAFSGTVGFEIGQRNLSLTGGGTVSTQAIIIGGTDLSARVTTGGDASAQGFILSGLDVGLVIARANALGDNRTWVSARGTADSVSVMGASSFGVDLSGQHLTLGLNLGLGQDSLGQNNATTLDWSGTKKLALKVGATGQVDLNFSGQLLEVGGTMSVRVGDQLNASGSLMISRQERDVVVGGRTIRAAGFVIGASNLQGSVAGVNLGGQGIDLALALMRPLNADAKDSRSWLALKARVDGLSLSAQQLGLPADSLDIQADVITLEANMALGALSGVPATEVLDLGQTASADRRIQVLTGQMANNTPETIALDFVGAGGAFLSLAMDAKISVAGSVLLQGTFGLARLGSRTVTLNDGNKRSMDVTMLSARNVSAQLGSGLGTDAFVGAMLSGANLGLMVLTDQEGGGTFVGMRATASSAALAGMSGLTLKGGMLSIGVNMGPGSGVLGGTVVDFTQGDLDGDGRISGTTAVRMRGATVSTLDFRTQTFEAGGTLTLELREANAAATAQPLLSGTGSFAVRVTGSGLTQRTVLGASGLQAMVNVQGQQAGMTNGSLLMVLPGQGYALTMSATAAIAVPGLAGTSVFGDVTVDLNRTGRAIQESLVVGGRTLSANFATGQDVTRFKLTNLDVSLS